MESLTKKPPSSLKSEHLIESVKPIIVCFGMPRDKILKDNINRLTEGKDVKGVVDVEFMPTEAKKKLGKLRTEEFNSGNTELGNYVMSQVNNLDKFSGGICDCTGLIVVGRDKKTGKNISFVSHQITKRGLISYSIMENFLEDLKGNLSKLKDKCDNGTIDVVAIGGDFSSTAEYMYSTKEYIDSIKFLTEQIKTIFGFEIVVVGGPKQVEHDAADSIYFDNKNRRLYLIKDSNLRKFYPAFTESTMEQEKQRWLSSE